MTKINDGGMAFPSGIMGQPQGMSLRDWFAGQTDTSGISFSSPDEAAAWMGIDTPTTFPDMLEMSAKMVARIRYIHADAMLAERSKGGA